MSDGLRPGLRLWVIVFVARDFIEARLILKSVCDADIAGGPRAVSYTHLTLPTILLV